MKSPQEILDNYRHEVLHNEDGKRGEEWDKSQALNDLYEAMLGVIGESNQHSHMTRNYCDDCYKRDIENKLRVEQRAKLKELFGMADNGTDS